MDSAGGVSWRRGAEVRCDRDRESVMKPAGLRTVTTVLGGVRPVCPPAGKAGWRPKIAMSKFFLFPCHGLGSNEPPCTVCGYMCLFAFKPR